jgi:hypothetical protein
VLIDAVVLVDQSVAGLLVDDRGCCVEVDSLGERPDFLGVLGSGHKLVGVLETANCPFAADQLE